jgi:hypothetical protein
LAGCKADEVEIELTESAVAAAASGDNRMVDFEAEFSNLGEMDDEQRADMQTVENIVAKHVSVDYFEVEQTDMGFEVAVEGQIPMTSDPDTADPWFILVQPSDVFPDTLRVQVVNGSDFDALGDEAQQVNFMLAPDASQPTRIRLEANAMEVLAPAVQVDGRYHLMWRGTVSDRISMTFKGGAYDSIGAGFFVR